MAASSGNGITVPVSLLILNLLQLVNELQNKLGNLKVGSSGFKAIESVIKTIRGEIDKLSILTSKPFVDASLFTKAERSVDKLEESLEKALMTISRIKFSDLELTPGLKADIKAFEDSINSIKEKIRTVKTTAKDEFLNSSLGLDWLKIDETAFSKSLTLITNDIRRAANDLKKELDELRLIAVDYLKALDLNERIKDFTDKMVDDPANGSDLFSKKWQELTKLLSDGNFKFQDRGKSLMVQWLESLLQLDKGTLDDLLKKSVTASNIGLKLKEILNSELAKNELVILSNTGADAKVQLMEAAYLQLLGILRQVGTSEELVAGVELILRNSLTDTTNALKLYEDRLIEAERNNTGFLNTTNAMSSLLENLRSTLQLTNAQFIQMQRTQLSFNLMKMAVVNFMGFNLVLNLSKRAIKEAINHIKELDTVMNNISIVTNMSTSDLWQLVDQYSKMAQTYGTTIKGAYEVSLIYYQQGLQTADVLTLTNETLKLAKVSGLDYAQTTDYMTTALRGFKMEMSEASTVVDVYSNLAAHTAVTLEELAVAMSKTASSMESVGSTFEEASAMIGTMVAVTRESATNIGSALKSIASRYGEMKSDPSILLDAEGEAIAYNKVDAALQSVGITLKTTDGQFRSFTDVILELSEVWDQLESTQLRYIATLFAGNRQQSRFLALVSNPELLKANLEYAENSEDTGTLQAIKALDSIESKLNLVLVAYQLFYTTLGVENVWKGLLDGTRTVIDTLNSLPKLFGKIPVGAIAVVGNILTLVKGLLTRGILGIASIWTSTLSLSGTLATTLGLVIGRNLMTSIESAIKAGTPAVLAAINAALSLLLTNGNIIPLNKELLTLFNIGNNNFKRSNSDWLKLAENYAKNGLMSQTELASALKAAAEGNEEAYRQAVERSNEAIRLLNGLLRENTAETNNNSDATAADITTKVSFFDKLKDGSSKLSRGLSAASMALVTVGMALDKSSEAGRIASGVFTGLGGALLTTASFGRLMAGDWTALPQLVMGVINIVNGFSLAIETPAEKLERLKKEAEELNNEAKEAKANYRTLDNSVKKIDELKEKRYESAEAAEEYQTAVDELASAFPLMIAGFDEAGNIILDTTDAERILAEAREKSKKATYDAAKAELDSAKEARDLAKDNLSKISVPSITSNLDDNIKGLIVEQRENIILKSLNTPLDPMLSSALEDSYETLKLFYQAAFDTENKKLKEGYEFLEKAKNPDTKKLELSRLEEYFTALIDNLSTLEYEIYSALFSLETPLDIAKRFTETAVKLSGLLDEGSTEEILNAYTELDNLLNLAARSKGFDETDLAGARAKMENLAKLISEITDLEDTYSGYEKAVISAWQQSSAADLKAWNVLSLSSTAAAMVTKLIALNITDAYFEDYDKALNAGAETDWQEYLNVMANFIKLLDEDNLALFNSMTNDSSFSGFDIIETFSKYLSEDSTKYIIDWYKTSIDSILLRLNNHLASSLGNVELLSDGNYEQVTDGMVQNRSEFYQQYLKLISDTNETNLTTIEEKYLNNILNLYDSLVEKGYSSRANDFGKAALSLYTEILSAPANIEKLLWQLINENGLTTLEGIKLIENTISNNADLLGYIDEDTLNLFYNNIIPNINLEIQTATSNLLETWEDTSKELSSAMSGGVSLKEADELILKASSLGVNISLDNFTLVGDKLILATDYYNQYYEALKANSEDQIKSILSAINAAKSIGADLRDGAIRLGEFLNSDKYKADLEAIGFNWKEASYWKADGTLSIDGIKALEEAIENNEKRLANYNRAALIAADQLKNAYDRSRGIYKLHTDDIVGLTKQLIEAYMDRTDLSWTGDDITIRAIIDEASQVYDTLMSDVFFKGWEKINLLDYEGLIDSDIASLLAFKDNKDYVGFALEYGKLAGKTIDEINDLVLLAYTKDNERFSEDLIKDVTFTSEDTFRITRESLKEIANAYDKDVLTIYEAYLESFDKTTGEFTLTIADLLKYGINLAQVKNFKTIVQESIDGLFSSLISDIQKALSGKLDTKGMTSLKENLDMLGINTPLDFTRTSEGIKLTENSFFSLYNTIKKTNNATAKQLIPSIKEISKLYGNLIDALKAWKQALDASNNEKAAAIADVISDYLRTSAEAYNWTNLSTPLEWQKANNLYTAAYNSRKTIYEAGTAGFMTDSDFYNLMSFLSSYNPDVEFGGHNAQYWLDHASDFFTVNSKGEFGINLREIGFTYLDYTKWIEAMIEAADKLREEGLAYEKTVESMNNGSKLLNWDNLIDATGHFSKEKLKTAINNNKDLKEGLSLIIINGTSLVDLIDDIPDELLESIIKRYSEGNFTEEELADQIIEMLGLDGENIEINFDKTTGKIHLNYNTDADLIIPTLKVGNLELTGEDLDIYNQLMEQTNAKLREGTNGFNITFEMSGCSVEAVYDTEAGYIYKVEGLGEYRSLEELQLALAVDNALKAEEESLTSNIKTYTFTLHGVKYEIAIDAEGLIVGGERTESGSVFNLTDEEIAKILAELDNSEKQTVTNEIKGEGKLSELELSLAEGYSAKIINDPVILTEDVGKATGKVASAEVIKSNTFTVDGLTALWDSIDKTHQYTEPFVATVLQLLVNLGENFQTPDGNNIWNILDTIDTNTYPEFTAYILALKVLKALSNFNLDDGQNIWDVLSTIDTKQYPEFKAFVESLSTVPIREGFINDNGQVIWDLVHVNPEAAYQFVALVASLTTSQDEQFVNDEGKTIWDLVESSSTNDYDFTAYITALKYLATAAAISAAETGPSKEDLNLKETYYSTDPIEYVLDVEVRYLYSGEEGDPLEELRKFHQGTGSDLEEFEKGFETFIEKYTTLIKNDGEHFTFKANIEIDELDISVPNGWQFDVSTQTFTTTANTYIPVSLLINELEINLELLNINKDVEDTNPVVEGQMSIEDVSEEELLTIVNNAEKNMDDLTLSPDLSLVKKIVDDYLPPKKIMYINAQVKGTLVASALAKGNVALAGGRRQTLMGELGPELYVQNGHYYIAGANGPEMVSLDDDAIVFNHIQTRRLMAKGSTFGHGRPVTNEYEAAGIAHASGSQPDWNKFSSWSLADAAIATAIEHMSRSASDSAWQELNKRDAEKWKRDYLIYINLMLAAKEQQLAAEALTNAAEDTANAAKEQQKTIPDSNKLHTGYVRATTNTGETVSTSAVNGYYKVKVPTTSSGSNPLSPLVESVIGSYGYNSGSGTSSTDASEARKQVQSVISKLLEAGFEAIDLSSSDFDKLDTALKAEMQEFINKADASYREFVRMYGEAAGYTVHEFNEQYFAAWLKDLDNIGVSTEIKDAAKNLSFFIGGAIGGAAEDWITLFGDYTSVTDLVDAGIIEWNDALELYIVTSMEALQQFDTNLDIDAFLDLIADSIRENISNTIDMVFKGLSGELGYLEFNTLNAYLKNSHLPEISDDMLTKTAEGLKVSDKYLIHFYSELKKVDAIQAQLVFKKLNESLKESNDHYKTSTDLLVHIKELLDAIDDKDRYNDTKIQLYLEELALAEEILAVRATSEDESMNFLDEDIPGGLKNPLNYANSWAKGWKAFLSAMGEDGSGIIDYLTFRNMAKQINSMAELAGSSLNFLGYTMDGSIESLEKIMVKAASSLGSSLDGSEFGVALSKFGDGLVSGMDAYAADADTAMHTMAESLIKVLDGLIAMFEMIVAMEEFEAADLDMNGILDLDEVFDLTGLTEDMYSTATKFTDAAKNAASTILKTMEDDSAFKAMAEQIKLNGYSFYELIQDAADGTREILDISAETYAQMLSLLYEGLKNGDYDPNDIYNSLKDFFVSNLSDFQGTVTLPDMIIDLKYGALVKITEEGYEAAGKTYDNQQDAIAAAVVAKTGARDIEVDGGNATGTLTLGNIDLTVSDINNELTYNGYSSLDKAIEAKYNESGSSLTLEQWKVELEIVVIPKLTANLKKSDLDLTLDLINAAIGTSFEKLEEEAASLSEIEFEAKYGIKMTETTTEADWAHFKELAGIESKNIEINASINIVNSAPILDQLLGTNSATTNVGANTKAVTDSAQKAVKDVNNMGASIAVSVDDLASGVISGIQAALNAIPSEVTTTVKIEQEGEIPNVEGTTTAAEGGESSAKGTVSGTAMAGGSRETLMGELGPELYVTNGRYYVAGQNGAEFVKLPDDAIVFNHLLTLKLLSTGSAGRGKPVTNEFNAVAMARGTEGPAAASARLILATLKEMRAMWQSIANMSVKELAGVGGTKTSSKDKKQVAAWLDSVERWYNLLQKIARLEKEINYEEALRNRLESERIPNGEAFYESLVKLLAALQQSVNSHRELAESQQKYLDMRREELNSEASPFSKFYTFDEGGQIVFKDNGFAQLEEIVHQTDQGKTLSVKEQYDKYISLFLLEGYALYRADGTEIKLSDYADDEGTIDYDQYYYDSIEAVWNRMESEQSEIQGLVDSISEHTIAVEDLTADANKILLAIKDNLLEIENQVLSAIEERELAIIDNLSDERKALLDSSTKYILGLQDSLNKEREAYSRQLSLNDLTSLLRRLSILLRSGGSAAEIASLLKEISDKQIDSYFDALEEAINKIQDASDLQLEKLQELIDLMNESLDYAKENGLFWEEVIAIMNLAPEDIVNFITTNSKDWNSKSLAALEEEIRKLTLESQEWAAYRNNRSQSVFDTLLAMAEGFTAVTLAIYNPEEINIDSIKGTDKYNLESSDAAAERERKKKEEEEAARKKKEEEEQRLTSYFPKDSNYYSYLEREGGLTAELALALVGGGSYSSYTGTMNDAYTLMRLYSGYASLPNSEGYRIYLEAMRVYNEALSLRGLEARKLKALGISVPGYSTGGLVDYTGLAVLHGSKDNPEYVLNAELTKAWMDEIANAKKYNDSILSIWDRMEAELLEMQKIYNSVRQEENKLNIESIDINMYVEKLADDYDARRAGDQVMNEILRIANKSTGNNRLGR